LLAEIVHTAPAAKRRETDPENINSLFCRYPRSEDISDAISLKVTERARYLRSRRRGDPTPGLQLRDIIDRDQVIRAENRSAFNYAK
jgi:hypothetical protein